MANPYAGRPPYTFWDRGVANLPFDQVDPVVDAPFRIPRGDPIVTAGSCFAQHVSQYLQKKDFNYLVTENFGGHAGTKDEGYGVFPARFGNIYTTRQLLQLFLRAYGMFNPKIDCVATAGGSVIDPFRPRIQTGGFADYDLLAEDRDRHLDAVRRMFEECRVFVFTLGLTESWMAAEDGAVYPLPPTLFSARDDASDYRFHNFGVMEIVDDLVRFLDLFEEVNRSAKVILTVSPVPLIATYEDRHVLVSTIASKSILRTAVEEVTRRKPRIAYFPSYEIVTGPQSGGRFFAADLREVKPEGVALVMSMFAAHYLESPSEKPRLDERQLSIEDDERFSELAGIICDEVEIGDRSS